MRLRGMMPVILLSLVLAGCAGEEVAQNEGTAGDRRVQELRGELDSAKRTVERLRSSVGEKNESIEGLREEISRLEAENERLASEAQYSSEKDSETGVGSALVRISGTQGLRFEGYLSSLDSSRSVEGSVPAEYEIEYQRGDFTFDFVDATFNKAITMNPQPGQLVVEIIVDGEVVNSAQTSAEYGSASASWSPAD